ncbi:MAG: adenosyl-hopene transferase HpnH [Chloroflexi bacterium]|nr:adenosyl-hopene transferase HpnH [Chloroflexota bacterium]
MAIPLKQATRVGAYIVKQRLARNDRYPLTLMLEPLYRCNLACAGCGKIQHADAILKAQLTPEQCWAAAEECGAPVVAIPGGEPLLHPQIERIVEGLIERGKFVYLCTNAILLQHKLDLFTPSPYFTFSVHMDGVREDHDASVCREGVYDVAVEAIREAKARGFRVTTNSTFFLGADPGRARQMFDEMMEIGVDGLMISPGYAYEKAPDQEHFLQREQTKELFREILQNPPDSWSFNHSELFLDFLKGEVEYECTPWGMPCYSVLGWQRPCYLLDEGYADTFQDLMEETEWDNYGPQSGNPKCQQCMVHSGFEASAVIDASTNVRAGLRTLRKAFA